MQMGTRLPVFKRWASKVSCPLTLTAVESRISSAAGGVPQLNDTRSKPTDSTAKPLQIFVLLMDPTSRRFELLQLEFDANKATVGDIQHQIKKGSPRRLQVKVVVLSVLQQKINLGQILGKYRHYKVRCLIYRQNRPLCKNMELQTQIN